MTWLCLGRVLNERTRKAHADGPQDSGISITGLEVLSFGLPVRLTDQPDATRTSLVGKAPDMHANGMTV